jgi:hypothetical protein
MPAHIRRFTWNYSPHFVEKKHETQQGSMTCPRSHNRQVEKLAFHRVPKFHTGLWSYPQATLCRQVLSSVNKDRNDTDNNKNK